MGVSKSLDLSTSITLALLVDCSVLRGALRSISLVWLPILLLLITGEDAHVHLIVSLVSPIVL